MAIPSWLRTWLLERLEAAGPIDEAEEGEIDPDDPANWLSLDYIHDQVQEQLKAQSDLWDAVDGRLRLILGVIGIVFAASATFQRQVTLGGTAQIPFWIGLFVGLAVVLFLIAGAIVAVAYWPQEFNRPPDPIDLRNRWLTTEPEEVKLIVIDSILEAYNDNEDVIERKNDAFKAAFVLTAVATAVMGLALIAQLTCQTVAPPWVWWPLEPSGC
jgi:hypothetical protein